MSKATVNNIELYYETAGSGESVLFIHGLEGLKHLGFLENIFVNNGNTGHEIVMVYDGALAKAELYEQAEMEVIEANGERIRVVWKSLHEFGEGKSILYPDGLLEMLK